MVRESDRNDWTYIAIGGRTSLQKLVRNHPEVIMGGNWCTGFDAYPGVPAPTDKTNIGCDMAAANYVLEVAAEANLWQQYFPAIHYVPVETVDVIDGDDYLLIKDAAEPSSPHYHKAAKATIGFYVAWSAAARASPELLVYKEAMTFDPATESTPQFDAVAVLVAMDIACGVSGARVAQHELANRVYFVTNWEAALAKDHPDFFWENLHRRRRTRSRRVMRHPSTTRFEKEATIPYEQPKTWKGPKKIPPASCILFI